MINFLKFLDFLADILANQNEVVKAEELREHLDPEDNSDDSESDSDEEYFTIRDITLNICKIIF